VKTNVRAFLAPMAFCAAALIVYAEAFHGDFHYDDSLTILENPHLSNWHTFIGHLDHMVRPVLSATFLMDRSLYGSDPSGYHLLNLLLHLGAGFLIYGIIASAIADERSIVPFWSSLLFLIHPIATETVTYLSGRASGLMAFFYLLALYLYIKASEEFRTARPRRFYLSGAVVCFLLAIGSKETAVTLPIILLLWDAVIRRLKGPALRAAIILRHSPFWVALLLAAAWAWSHPRYTALAEFSFTIRPLWDHLLSELHAAAYALSLLFCPWDQNFDHDLPVFHSPTQWPLPLDLLLLSAVAVGILFSARRFPLAAFGLAWFLIQMLPASLIPRNDLLSERNLYLPAIGLLLALVALGSHLIQWLLTIVRRPALVRFGSSVLATGLIAALCFFTYQRNLLYQDRLLLWSDAVAKSPNKARPHNNLGYAYALRDDWDHAIEEFRTAARLDPDFFLAQQNLRDAYLYHVGRQ
jgi:tetratricopeptide (TPR) repeat protein